MTNGLVVTQLDGRRWIDIDLVKDKEFYVNKKLDLWVCKQKLREFFDLPEVDTITIRITDRQTIGETVRVEPVDMIDQFDKRWPGIIVEYYNFFSDDVFKLLITDAIKVLGCSIHVKVLYE